MAEPLEAAPQAMACLAGFGAPGAVAARGLLHQRLNALGFDLPALDDGARFGAAAALHFPSAPRLACPPTISALSA
ncbi:hypothetical protein HF313_16675 [Massilia atriviolacea]